MLLRQFNKNGHGGHNNVADGERGIWNVYKILDDKPKGKRPRV